MPSEKKKNLKFTAQKNMMLTPKYGKKPYMSRRTSNTDGRSMTPEHQSEQKIPYYFSVRKQMTMFSLNRKDSVLCGLVPLSANRNSSQAIQHKYRSKDRQVHVFHMAKGTWTYSTSLQRRDHITCGLRT